MPGRKPSSGKRAAKKTVKATEEKFGKAARVSAQRSGQKPMAWQQSEAPKRAPYVPPVAKPVVAAPVTGAKTSAVKSAPVPLMLNKIGSAAVEQATGRTWEQWLPLLDADDAKRMTHKEIAAHLKSMYAVDAWWSQMVAVGYEQARGLRVRQQTANGFTISSTRTMDASVSAVFRAFNDPTRRDWCHERLYSVQSAVAPRMLRLAMADKSTVTVSIARKGNTRTMVSIEQTKMADAQAADQAKLAWKQALDRMAMLLDE